MRVPWLTWRLELPQWLVLAALFVAGLVLWPEFPRRVPIHWNAAGEVDRHGGRFEALFLVPLIALGLYALLAAIPAVDPERGSYRGFRTVYALIRLTTLLVLAVVQVAIVLSALGVDVPMELLAPVLVGAVFVALGALLSRVPPNWFVGIRTPWTLSSPEVWRRTHRVGGRVLVVMGLLVAATCLLPAPSNVLVMIGVITAGTLGLVLFSLVAWTRTRRDADAGGSADVTDG